jgi:hypothetical protein
MAEILLPAGCKQLTEFWEAQDTITPFATWLRQHRGPRPAA